MTAVFFCYQIINRNFKDKSKNFSKFDRSLNVYYESFLSNSTIFKKLHRRDRRNELFQHKIFKRIL